MEEIIKVLKEIRPDVDFVNEKKLIDNKILDSFDIITIVGVLNEKFDIAINVEDLVAANFNSVEAMQEMINRLQDE